MTPEQKMIWAAVYGATWARLNAEFDKAIDPPENQEAANVITASIYAANAIMDLASSLDDVRGAAGSGSAVYEMAKEMGSDPGFEEANAMVWPVEVPDCEVGPSGRHQMQIGAFVDETHSTRVLFCGHPGCTYEETVKVGRAGGHD